jgi:hypothetical protein
VLDDPPSQKTRPVSLSIKADSPMMEVSARNPKAAVIGTFIADVEQTLELEDNNKTTSRNGQNQL